LNMIPKGDLGKGFGKSFARAVWGPEICYVLRSPT
jgi:hypothetical protein